MNDWLDRTIRDDHRAKGVLREYVYEISVSAESAEGAEPSGTALLRLTAEPSPSWGGVQASDGSSSRPETNWKYILRTQVRQDSGGVVVAEPFSGGLPFTVTGVGPWEAEPEGGFDPDVLAARLLAFVSDWRRPEGPLTPDQCEWFRWLGPAIDTLLPAEEEAAVEWIRDHRPADQ
ncbi:hypothetical protein [Streptomyces sp. NPDC056169]|uniref:hypothetical protein n=1 Tax=Streptomyces sp. NPDC056169 TaxID=3345734 RepID=UPI0035E08B17